MAKSKFTSFKNNKGRTVVLPSKMTIEDLVKCGMRGIRLRSKPEPLPDGWYASLDCVGGDGCKVSVETIKRK